MSQKTESLQKWAFHFFQNTPIFSSLMWYPPDIMGDPKENKIRLCAHTASVSEGKNCKLKSQWSGNDALNIEGTWKAIPFTLVHITWFRNSITGTKGWQDRTIWQTTGNLVSDNPWQISCVSYSCGNHRRSNCGHWVILLDCCGFQEESTTKLVNPSLH
jgi:hypothetical protein